MTPLTAKLGEQPVRQLVLLRVLTLLRNVGVLVSAGPTVPAPVDADRLEWEVSWAGRHAADRQTPFDWEQMWILVQLPQWDLLADWLGRLLARRPPLPEADGDTGAG
jgi:hypothetical protein